MSSSSDDDDDYCPALPPHLLQNKRDEEEEEPPEKSPVTTMIIGPSLPPGYSKTNFESIMTQQEEQLDEQVDPTPTLRERRVTTGSLVAATTDQGYQPAATHDYDYVDNNNPDDDDDDEEDIGPYPPDHPKAKLPYDGHRLLKREEKSKPKREEWMLVPPTNKPISGLAPRKFLTRSLETRNDEDDETNEEQDIKEEFQAKLIEERDKLMSNLQSESNTRKSESLLETHRKDLKKRKLEEAKKKDGSEKKERRPFDRDSDLKVSGMNEDAKKRFINRATSELQGRFSHSKKTGKFL